MPWTLAITGWGTSWSVSIITLQRSNRWAKNSLSRPIISDRSCPAEKAGPAPSITIARVSCRADTSRRAAIISSISSSDSALRFSGRLSTIRAADPSRVTSKFR